MSVTSNSTLQLAAHVACEVGKSYLVPCLWVDRKGTHTPWVPRSGWAPVLGPKHTDAEHLNFPFPHYHIDWRFVPAAEFAAACRPHAGVPHNRVISVTHGNRIGIHGETVLKRRRCLRPMPDFPVVAALVRSRSGKAWPTLELAQTFACNKLKPGNVCPHRGIDLTPFAQTDGTAICPGHGLRWNLKTGELMPYQLQEAAHACPR